MSELSAGDGSACAQPPGQPQSQGDGVQASEQGSTSTGVSNEEAMTSSALQLTSSTQHSTPKGSFFTGAALPVIKASGLSFLSVPLKLAHRRIAGSSSCSKGANDPSEQGGAPAALPMRVSGHTARRCGPQLAELRIALQETLQTAERLTSPFMRSLEGAGWKIEKIVVEAERARARW